MALDVICQVHLWGSLTKCVRWSPWSPRGRGYLGDEPQPKHAIANCCCHLTNTNEKRFRLLPNYVGVCSLFIHFHPFTFVVLWSHSCRIFISHT